MKKHNIASCWGNSKRYPYYASCPGAIRGWSGGAMVLGKLPVPGRPTILI